MKRKVSLSGSIQCSVFTDAKHFVVSAGQISQCPLLEFMNIINVFRQEEHDSTYSATAIRPERGGDCSLEFLSSVNLGFTWVQTLCLSRQSGESTCMRGSESSQM